jgi:hypothetical protein
MKEFKRDFFNSELKEKKNVNKDEKKENVLDVNNKLNEKVIETLLIESVIHENEERIENEENKAKISKECIRICEKEIPISIQIMEDKHEDNESGSVELDDYILPYEECIITVFPKKNREIKNIISAYIPVEKNNINFDLLYTIGDLNSNDNKFNMYVKNNSDKKTKIKINYNVMF